MEEQNNNQQENKEELTHHEKKELKKQQKEQEKHSSHESKSKKNTNRKYVNYGITAIILLLIIVGGYYFIIKPIKGFQPFTSGPVHWHANFEVFLCGERQDFTTGYDFEKNRLGSHILHSHNDNVIHIEGQIPKREDIAIGNFFDLIGVPFSSTQIMDKTNGDLCTSGEPGTVKMIVNGEPNNEFRDFIPKACESPNIKQDCDKIEIRFE